MISLRVLIVADDPLARGGLAALLANRSECVVVGQIASDADVLSDAAVYRPDVVLWDVGWEQTLPVRVTLPAPQTAKSDSSVSHLDHLAALLEAKYPVLVLLPDQTLLAEMWAVGVRGLLFREAPEDRLITALQAVPQGLTVLDATFAGALLSPTPSDPSHDGNVLTPREKDVLKLLAEGLTNKTIADCLRISDHTVKFHVNAIMSKLGAQSRTDAVVRATRQGLLLL